MDVIHGRRVVVFEHVPADAIDHGRIKRIEPFGTSEQQGAALAGERVQRPNGCFDRRFTAPADGAADKIEKRSLGFVYNIGGNLFIPAGDDVRRQCFRLRHAMIVHLRFMKGAVCG